MPSKVLLLDKTNVGMYELVQASGLFMKIYWEIV